MQELLNKSIELNVLIQELKNCAKIMDNESPEFNNTTALIKQYTLEKVRIDEALKIWNKA